MKCKHCGNSLEAKPAKDPWHMYQSKCGTVISKLFDPDNIPDGWYDSPGAAKAGEVKVEAKPEVIKADKPKRTRRTPAQMAAAKLKAVEDVNSTRPD